MSNQFDLSEVAEIIECMESTNYVNKYLKLGWTLIAIRIEERGVPGQPDQKTVYCLGWPKSLGEPKYQ